MLKKTILEMKNISIEFPGVKALKEVDFSTETGTTHGIIGANGAGKSTLMKVLSGAYNHYTGDIYLGGKKANIRSPKDAQSLGIQIVYQEVDTALIPYLTVGENIMLNETVNHMRGKQFVDWKRIHKRAAEILEDMNVHISTKKLVSDLTLAEKQMILIARAISQECKFLILDEPTAPLSHAETEELFRIINELKENNNVGIIFISHRLPELMAICDDLTIMRNGKFVVRNKVKELDENQIIEYMLGKKMEKQFPKNKGKIGETVLEVIGLRDINKLKDIHFHVKSGEIVGIAGLVGAGKTELSKALLGSSKIVDGKVLLNGKPLKLKAPHHVVKKGIALVPEERRKEGVLIEESVAVNISASNLTKFTKRFSFLDFKKEKSVTQEMIKQLGIVTPSEQTKVKNLSGGNQQKVVIGKWLVTDSDVYVFDEPTKGVDVGAKRDIFDLISQLAQQGKAILYLSSELAEIMGITDRVYVIYDGKIVKEFITSKTNEEELLYYSTGGK